MKAEGRHAETRFEVSVNGIVKCVVGVAEFGVISTIVGWVKRSPEKIPATVQGKRGFNREEFLEEEINLDVGGLDSVTDVHLKWLEQSLVPGDVVTIRVLGPGEFDPPAR